MEKSGVIKSSNIMHKYAVAGDIQDKKVVGHLPLGKSRKICKDNFLFFQSRKKMHSCWISATGKAANAGKSLKMKVSCRLFFITEEMYVNILQEKLNVLL